jgi:large subunit ribosomal protein L14
MLFANSCLVVADNSGAKVVKCIKILGGSFHTCGGVGDFFVVAVQTRTPDSKYLKKKIQLGLVVGTRKLLRRRAGNYIQFGENRILLLSDKTKFMSSRVDGPIATEIRLKKIFKIVSLADVIV